MMSEERVSDPSSANRAGFNRTTAQGEWRRRISRAEQLERENSSAAEMLRFYSVVARFQQEVFSGWGRLLRSEEHVSQLIASPLTPEMASQFLPFVELVERQGPTSLKEAAQKIRSASPESHLQMLNAFWDGGESSSLPPGPADFFARAFLQPYAASIRSKTTLQSSGPAPFSCPLCKRKPGLSVLRPLGDGGQRSLICSFCLAEWGFRRIVCPGCGEENHAKLPVYTAEEFKHVRVEACDSCRIYIKNVDMTRNGLAEPVVDEIASVSLDVWAQSQGYTKLQANLLQM